MKDRRLTIENYLDSHFIHRSNWLRAAVLGANDGIISISSLAIGVASAGTTRDPILLATVAGFAAFALSSADAGESTGALTDRMNALRESMDRLDARKAYQSLNELTEELALCDFGQCNSSKKGVVGFPKKVVQSRMCACCLTLCMQWLLNF